MRPNKIKLGLHSIQKEIDKEMATKDTHIENILSLPAERIMSFITAVEFNLLVKKLPKDNIHFLALLLKRKFEFLDIEAYEYLYEIQHYIDND